MQIVWSKVNWLTGAINLTPWYLTYNGTNPTTPVSSDAGPVSLITNYRSAVISVLASAAPDINNL